METFVAEVAGMHFTEERKVAIEVGIPSDRTNSQGRDGSKGCTRAQKGL